MAATFSMNIVTMDFFMSKPIAHFDPVHSPLRNFVVQKVPVIRIFGNSLEGKKACVLVHGVFPYMYIPYRQEPITEATLQQIAASIDKALNIALGYKDTVQHVFHVSVCKKIPMYGYQEQPMTFLKILLYEPYHVRKLEDLLLNGAVCNERFQPHESHVPFVLQFSMDYNLYGMSYIAFSAIKFRGVSETSLPKLSHCELEADVKAESIAIDLVTNVEVEMKNPGLHAIWKDEERRRRAMNKRGTITPQCSQVRVASIHNTEKIFTEKLRDNIKNHKRRNRSILSMSSLDDTVLQDDMNSTLDAMILDQLNELAEDNTQRQSIDEDSILGTQMIDEEPDHLEEEMSSAPVEEDADTTIGGMLLDQLNELAENNTQRQSIDEDSILGTQMIDEEPHHLEEEMSSAPVGEDADTTISGMLLDQLNEFAENNTQRQSIDEDSILGTQMIEEDMSNIPAHEADVTIYEKPQQLTPDVASNRSSQDMFAELHLSPAACKPKLTSSGSSNDLLVSPDSSSVKRKLLQKAYEDQGILENLVVSSDEHVEEKHSRVQLPEKANCCELPESLTPRTKRERISSLSESDIFSQSNTPKSTHEEPISLSSDLEKHIISSESSHLTSSSKHLADCIKPKRKPISRALVVEELIRNDVCNIQSKEPFYSNLKDITRSELSNKYLHLQKAPVTLLEEHKSQNSGLKDWRQRVCVEFTGDPSRDVDDVILNYCRVFPPSCNLIKPIIKPPSSKGVSRWLRCKKVLRKQTEVKSKTEDVVPDKMADSPCSSQKGVLRLECFDESSPIDVSVVADESVIATTLIEHEQISCSFNVEHSITENTSTGKSTPCLGDVKRKSSRSSFESDIFPSSPSPESGQSSPNNATSNDSIHRDLMKSFIRRQLITPKRRVNNSFAIETTTPDTTGNFLMGLDNLNEVTSHVENYYLTVLAVEVHAISRALLKPDPNYDEVKAIFYYLYTSPPEEDRRLGIMLIGQERELPEVQGKPIELYFATNERELFAHFIEKVRQWDPDILIGYEIETLSWGYLLERGYILDLNLNQELSRITETDKRNTNKEKKEIESCQLQVAGRIIINLWRLLRHEVTLQSYTFENIMYHVLHERVPLHSYKHLTSWWEHRTKLYKWMTVEHYLIRVTGVIRLVEQLDLIGRTSEMARLFGIQFFEVLSRGSQFRVESIMLRLARLDNYIAISPSVKQRAYMRAPESLPLILEPESKLYTDPIIVLDFQSLYPSVIIAYNYCFSTCLGRVEHLGIADTFPFGCVDLNVPIESLKKLQKNLSISPSGVAFVDKSIRCGILPRMLQEILDTRLMVKQSMKQYKGNAALQRVLHARQLGLKLIANVTYGYTAANFSGRMPCVEVGDSVVSKGRETLQKAIETVNNTKKWQCRVVYGDTDSMFVLAPGRTKQEAFEIGKEIADVVTNNNPTPVKLKFEKVYHPCILQTKKRYVGFMYETADQADPVYEAKGIETVRRDGCPAVAKILKKCLCLLFETRDLSSVKEYVEKQFSKIISGRVSVQDLTFAKEYRGQAGYKPGACVPALSLARTWLQTDARSEPRVGERVPYVIVSGAPGLPLIKLVRSPHELLQDFSLRLNSEYYITRVIVPPLERCFLLLGVPVMPWYANLPRKLFVYLPSVLSERKKRSTISQYFSTVNCVCCNAVTQNKKGVCDGCLTEPQLLATCLYYKIHAWQRAQHLIDQVCMSCVGRRTCTECISLDCSVLYRKTQIKRDLDQLPYVLSLCDSHLSLF